MKRTIWIIFLAVVIVLAIAVYLINRGGESETAPPPPPPTSTPMPTSAPPPTQAPAEEAPIQGIVWMWLSVTDQPAGATESVPNPASYTIVFNADETLYGTADCNSFEGTYSQRGGFSINIRSSTRAYCGETSLDQKYLDLLGKVAAGGPDGAGNLALETAGGAQRMIFDNGGAAP